MDRSRRRASFRRRQRGVALLETIVFFGAIVLLYVAASAFGQRWLTVQQTHHATQAALFDGAWGRTVSEEGVALVGERSMDVSGRREMRAAVGDWLVLALETAWDLVVGEPETFPIEPFSGRLLIHDAEAESTLHPPPEVRQGWLAEGPLDLEASMPASTPSCWWPHTFLFDFTVGHYTWVVEELTSLGNFDRPLLNWGI